MKNKFLLIIISVLLSFSYLDAQTITRQLLSDTVTLWANAKFISVDEFKNQINRENAKYGLSQKFDEKYIIYDKDGKIVTNYKNFIITVQKVIKDSSKYYYVSMTFWDNILDKDVSTVLTLEESNKIINYLSKPYNILNLQNNDIVSFKNFKIIKSKNRFFISIKDIYYGERLVEILDNKNRNEFNEILMGLEKAKRIINQDIKKG